MKNVLGNFCYAGIGGVFRSLGELSFMIGAQAMNQNFPPGSEN